MAIFGFHFVLSLIAVTVFSKINSRFSICEWAVIRGLYYYLLQSSIVPNIKSFNGKEQKRRRRNGSALAEDDAAADRLVRVPLSVAALDGVPFLGFLLWTYNYFVFALAIFVVSDLFGLLFPANLDRNTSVIWLVCALFFFLHVLFHLTAVKLAVRELRAERNVLVCFAAVLFLGALVLVMFGDAFLDVDIGGGYTALIAALDDVLATRAFGFTAIGPTTTMASESPVSGSVPQASPLLFLVALAVILTLIGTTLLFPVFQYAGQYVELAERLDERSPIKFTLHASFFLPLFIFLLYTNPVKEHFMRTSGISSDALDALRVAFVIVWAALRCSVARLHLQAFLDQPLAKAMEWRHEANHHHHLSADEKRTKIAYYASYFCAAALQYFLPVFVTLSTALLLKHLGAIEFTTLLGWFTPSTSPPTAANNATATTSGSRALDAFLSARTQKPLWTLCLATLLGMQAALAAIGVIFKRVDADAVSATRRH